MGAKAGALPWQHSLSTTPAFTAGIPMATTTSFIASNSMQSVAKAAGINAEGFAADMCSFVVGDVICFPEAPALAFVVERRMYSPPSPTKPAKWYLFLEPTKHPLDED